MNSSFFLGSVAVAIGFFRLFKKFRFSQDTEDTKSSSLSLPSPPTSLSLPSPSTSLCRTWKHNVFPSFHGADVRTTVLSHILESFKRKGIETFIDNNIERSKSIGPALKEAIRGSKIAIVLLSRKYASSSWCLDELVEIMKCREVLGQIVMTIFYEVDPTDIKKQTGDFGKVFRKTCKGKSKEHTERWRKALEDVATIAGEHSCKWNNEAAMIEKIATDVSNILNNSTPSRDFDGLVGMRTHMEEMKGLLRLDLDEEVRMIGIWGPPGIGKTTIARVLLNQVSSRFQLDAIMVNIKGCYPRPCFDEYNAQLQLQSQMLSQIINQKDIQISHLGVAQERLKDKKVLLVLDEVDQLGQLDALAKEIQWFGPGSRIIITTEDLRVLNAHRIHHIYKVKFPSSDEAFQIFCMHAFGKKHPDDGFYELAWEVTYLAGKLPLGLKVLGSSLRRRSKKEWKRILPRLKSRLDGEIESIIKFSYDDLHDDEKYIFLYIACLFNYQSAHKVEGVLANTFSHVRDGLHILEERSFLSIEHGEIWMHSLLEQFGKETSRKQFVHHGLTKRQLLVGERDTSELLSDDSTDSKRFIGIHLDFSKTEEELNISEKALERMHDFQFVRIDYPYFAQLERLQGLIYHSQKIRLLDWKYFNNICLPSTFNPEFLVEVNMRFSKLEKLWGGTKPLRNLKWMDSSHSRYLKELPDLSTATKLEELILKDCSSLVELPSSIGNAINLQELDLSGCTSLVKLPSPIGNATNLRILDLSDCSNLVELPSIGNLTKLERLDLSNCSTLVRLPSSINAPNLQELFLRNYSRVVELPALENATNLQKLDISGCSSLVKLPSSIRDLINLREFDLSHCSSLQEFPPSIGTATNLQRLDISGCSSLVKLPSSIGDLINLKYFFLSYCSSLMELPSSIGNLQTLCDLIMCGCSKLEALPTNINLESLRLLDLRDCSQLKSFPEISTNIEDLKLTGTAIKEVPLSIMSWSRLSNFGMSYFESLKEFPHAFNIITKLHLVKEDIKEVPPWVKGMSRLRKLRLYNCNSLVSLPQFSDSLSDLVAENCQSLERLDLVNEDIKEVPPWVKGMSRLRKLRLYNCNSLVSLPQFSDSLSDLVAENCQSLERLDLVNEDIKEVPPWVKGMSRLRKLRLYNCNSLVSLPQFSDSLHYLVAENCQSLERLDGSFKHPNIRLEFVNCLKLNQEARDLIMHTSTRNYAMLPGTEVPDCFNYRATGGGSLTIKLNESPLPTSLRFKACFMLLKDEEGMGDIDKKKKKGMGDNQSGMLVYIDIMDKQNGLRVRRIDRVLTEHIYTFEVKAEEVTSTELVFQFKTDSSKWKIGECGLLQIKKEESEEDRDEKKEESENSTLASCRI